MVAPLEILLEELRISETTPSPAALHYLSNLDVEGARRVREVWSQIAVGVRQQVTARLVEMAEADFEVNFNAVFYIGMEDEDADVRLSAIEGLWEDEDVTLIAPLAARLREDESPAVRACAAQSLGRFILLGELQKIRAEFQSIAYEAVLAACQDPHETAEVRRRALESLAYVGNDTVVSLIRQAYASPDRKMRASALFAMGRSADTRWAEHVQGELFNPDPEMRYEAARACGELQLRRAVPDLEELADDADREVQEAALWALGQVGGERARKILERYCRADDEPARAAAEAALDELEFMHGDLSDFLLRLADVDEDDWLVDEE